MTNRPIARVLRSIGGSLLTGSLLCVASAQQSLPPRTVINQYCIACHNQKANIGGLALDTSDLGNVGASPQIWEKVVRKLSVRMMPPPGMPRPDEATYNSVISYLETSLDRAAAANPNPGRTEMLHRLSRTEYHNSIRDLLALDVDVTALLPKDDVTYGFDNVNLTSVSPGLLERYLTAARKISRVALGAPVPSPESKTVTLPVDRTQEDNFEELPLGTRGGAPAHYTFPIDGEYQIQVRLARNRNENVEGLIEEHQLDVLLDGARVQLFTVKPMRSTENGLYDDQIADKHLNARVHVTAGPHTVVATFLQKRSALSEDARQPVPVYYNMDRHPRPQPAVYSVSITGPFSPTGPGDTPSRHRLLVCRPAKPSDEDGCAGTILSTLARRAYRRTVTPEDLRQPLAFYKEARSQGGFEAGIEIAVQSILTSPQFLFRIERDPANVAPNQPYRVSDVELASRLSFFLWSSIPDDELLDLAIKGKLRDAKVLEGQVRRMMTDSRSSSLVSSFAEQWLYLRNLDAVAPDPREFLEFDDNLRQAFRRETELFFESIVKEDRSVVDLLEAKYTFLNERLAKYYGVPHVYGSHFRRVTLDDASPRGGLLGQGSILTVTSYANRTSPVLRGKWILENIVGVAPPPPPPNVPPLGDQNPGKLLTMRERMVQHRSNPACASCHQLMDPIGLSMENFDAVGAWRSFGEGDAPIDTSGSLLGGAAFEGVSGLKRALLSRPELFVTTLTGKLLTYGVGRSIDYYDAPAIRGITREARAADYRFSSLILGVVKSRPFQMRRSQ